LVLGVAQFVGWFIFLVPGLLGAILAIVLGFVATNQVSRSGESGRGMAITGVVLGFLGILVVGLLVIVGSTSASSQPSSRAPAPGVRLLRTRRLRRSAVR